MFKFFSFFLKETEQENLGDSDLDETAWRDKLADECQHEYNTTWGKYEHGLFYCVIFLMKTLGTEA